jgi:hypothetical protein
MMGEEVRIKRIRDAVNTDFDSAEFNAVVFYRNGSTAWDWQAAGGIRNS